MICFCLPVPAAVDESPAPRDARMKWWREARFGLFIHFGPVTLTGKEISWSRANSNPKCPNHGPTPVAVYDQLYKSFNPTNFSAGDWAGVAKLAGMKYVVLTTKHCDGFLLWASKVDAYNISATPFHRDLCAELAKAVRQDGLRLGWYFSPMDWRDPDFRTERNAAFVGRMQGEVSELLNKYGRIDLMWFDFDGGEAVYDQTNTYALVKQAQPHIIIDNRLDLGVKTSNTALLSPNADYYTPEQRIGSYDDRHPWETCMTLGTQWSWKPDDKIKSAERSHRHPCAHGGRRWESVARCRPDAGWTHRAAAGGGAETGRRVAEGERRQHLRHSRRPVQTGRLRCEHPQGRNDLCPHSQMAQRPVDAARPSRRKLSAPEPWTAAMRISARRRQESKFPSLPPITTPPTRWLR